MITMTNLEPMKTGQVDLIRQLCAAGEIVETPPADQPDGDVAARRQGLQRKPRVLAQAWNRGIDIERRERSVEIGQHHQMSSRRPRVDCRQHLGHHLGIVVTQPIHATSSA